MKTICRLSPDIPSGRAAPTRLLLLLGVLGAISLSACAQDPVPDPSASAASEAASLSKPVTPDSGKPGKFDTASWDNTVWE